MKRIQDTLIEERFDDDGLYFRFEEWEALVTNPLSEKGFWIYVSRPVSVKPAGRKQFLEMINGWRKEHGLESTERVKMSFMLSDTFPKENNPLKGKNWKDLIK
jgi:hypothetical protein